MLDVSHNLWLVAASLAVALMAGFTGLSLTQGVSALPEPRRKMVVAMAAVVLGGGIWSMHFVAMLGLQLPILFYYDALITLISALLAILVVGVALLLLHFRQRSTQVKVGAGAIVGLGIVVMHYVGMAGMQVCRPVYGSFDIAIATVASVVLSVVAIWVAYDSRTHRNIVLGTVCFGVAVFSVHFVAMGLTGFVATATEAAVGPPLDNRVLAMGVTVAAFLICGAFFLTGITFVDPASTQAEDAPASLALPDEPVATDHPPRVSRTQVGIPYEREGQTFFADPGSVAAIRAEGHYTLLYVDAEKLFCPWSITEAEKRLATAGFLKVHRSYLVNPAHVSSFERHKDNGTCYFDRVASLPKVPVSRSRLPAIRTALGL